MLTSTMLGSVSRAPVARMQMPTMQDPPMMQGLPPMLEEPRFFVEDMPGVCAPMGFWDPMGFTYGASEGKVKFYREVELKHGRVAMLAAAGFVLAEKWHPMFGGKINVPSLYAYKETPLSKSQLMVLFIIGIHEVFSIFTFNSPFGGEAWSIRSDYANGDLGFDPLNLKPNTPFEYKVMQTKELNNGRLAMIAIAGMVGQELATGKKLFL